MGRPLLIDTNVLIDLFLKRIPQEGAEWLVAKLNNEIFYLSVINQIELLGFPGDQFEMKYLKEVVDRSNVLPLNRAVVKTTIELRSAVKLKLPDAIIAATALNFDLCLVSRNVKDFDRINGLSLVNPHDPTTIPT